MIEDIIWGRIGFLLIKKDVDFLSLVILKVLQAQILIFFGIYCPIYDSSIHFDLDFKAWDLLWGISEWRSQWQVARVANFLIVPYSILQVKVAVNIYFFIIHVDIAEADQFHKLISVKLSVFPGHIFIHFQFFI